MIDRPAEDDSAEIPREEAQAPMMPPRPQGCAALLTGDLVCCARCGLEWRAAGGTAPSCRPVTYAAMCARMMSEVVRAEASLACVRHLELPTDGGSAALRRLAELEAVSRTIEAIAADEVSKKRLKELAK